MKHLVAKEHHRHLKKRAILEAIGLALLIALSINQRELIGTALETLRNSDLLYLFIMFSVYWLMLPLTTISYRLLASKKLPFKSTMLAQMAGAGPGRIIPGGLGHISIGTVHLQKCGMSVRKAVVITVTNNVIGLILNVGLIIAAFIYHPDFLDSVAEKFSMQTITLLVALAVGLVSLGLWVSHARSTRRTLRKINKHWRHMLHRLLTHPVRLLTLFIIAGAILLGHVSILILAGESIGQHITLIDALIALSTGVLVGGAVPTPGGLGAVEAGTISALILLGYDATTATSVSLLFRLATYWQPLLPGVAAYLYLREQDLL